MAGEDSFCLHDFWNAGITGIQNEGGGAFITNGNQAAINDPATSGTPAVTMVGLTIAQLTTALGSINAAALLSNVDVTVNIIHPNLNQISIELRRVIVETADDLATFPEWPIGEFMPDSDEADYWKRRYPGT